MIIRSVEIEQFRSFENVSFALGKRLTAISGRNATQKTTVLGMIGQPFTISSKSHPMYGCKTIDGYNFRSQFKEKFKISPTHDIIGEHKWKLLLHNGVYEQSEYSVESIARKQKGHDPTLRFWNAKSRAKGAGYIQLPVYFLSLSRLFPIGESGKTKSLPMSLSPEELEYCITNYRTILSIQNITGSPSVGAVQSSSSKTFSGVSDGIHDIFTNSAGEGNITRIILAILSFKRLMETYPRDYKGGILLIDELDATLYGFSQSKLVDYLWESAGKYRIQIIFTTHSPLILKEVNKYQRAERARLGINLPLYAYDSSIVYLKPQYADDGKRYIMPENVTTATQLNLVLNDINLSLPTSQSKLNIYCEDTRAISFLQYILNLKLGINLDLYMTFIDINLGWTNYVQLAQKNVPEFRKNLIILDGDVPSKKEFQNKKAVVNSFGNFLFLPLVIEKDMFEFLKDHAIFSKFESTLHASPGFNYDICFNNWPLESSKYSTLDFKNWYSQIESYVGNQDTLFNFWCNEHSLEVDTFVESFISTFNTFAEQNSVDSLPMINPEAAE